METQLVFSSIIYDTQQIGEKDEIAFFIESEINDNSVKSIIEKEAVKLILSPRFKDTFLSEFFSDKSNLSFHTELQSPFTEQNKKPGDIDLLIFDKRRPDLATAFECKVVKSEILESGNVSINKLVKLQNSIKQVNEYLELGFHKVYLLVVILDDARKSNLPNVALRSSNSSQLSEVYNIVFNESIKEDIGIGFVTISQQTGKSIDSMGFFGVCNDRKAKPREQLTTMTNKIKQNLK